MNTPRQNHNICIIIINWRRPEDTCHCLASLLQSADSSSIIVLDNGSHDGSTALIRQQFPDIVLLEMDTNLGFARAANIGIAHAIDCGVDGVLLINNDAIVAADAIQQLTAYAFASERVGIAAAKVFMADAPNHLWAVGGVYRDRRVINLGSGEQDQGQYDDYPLDFVYGCAMFVKTSLVRTIGGFDERFFMYYEDVDLCLRARAAGYSVGLAPQAHVWHAGARSTHSQPALKIFYETRSRMLFFAKHLKPNERLAFAAAEIIYLIALVCRRAIAGDLRGAAAYLRGYLAAIIC